MSSNELEPVNEIFCSCVISTVGRGTVVRAVNSVVSQSLEGGGFEVILVNDSGKPLPDQGWERSDRLQVIHTNRCERSAARNTGASIARGCYLHFLDDDDWIADGAYQRLWELSQTTDAKWLYGRTQLLDRQDQATIVLKHELQGNCFAQAMAGEWIPLQSSMIERKAFWKVGGFNPLLSGPEDIDLQRRILLESDIAETPNLVAYVMRGEQGSTTDYLQHSRLSRWAREGILNSQNTFQRMHASASSPFWRGHMVRVYLTSMIWNLQHRRLLTAVSRAAFGMISMLSAWKNAGRKNFWLSVFRSYKSLTFKRGIEEAERTKDGGG